MGNPCEGREGPGSKGRPWKKGEFHAKGKPPVGRMKPRRKGDVPDTRAEDPGRVPDPWRKMKATGRKGETPGRKEAPVGVGVAKLHRRAVPRD